MAEETPVKRLPPSPVFLESLRGLAELGPDNPRMPESAFRDFIRHLYNPAKDEFNLLLWRTTFGPTRKGIDITDPAGQVLFTCPPLIGTVATRMGVPTEESLSNLAEMAALNEKRHAQLGAETLNAGLAQYRGGAPITVEAGWREVLRRYDLLPAGDPAATGSPAAGMDLLGGPEDEL